MNRLKKLIQFILSVIKQIILFLLLNNYVTFNVKHIKFNIQVNKSKGIKRTTCHGACIEEQHSKLLFSKSKKYNEIQSTYSNKNLSTYLNEDNNKYR